MKDKPLRRHDMENTIKRLRGDLCYTNRVIELFLPPQTSDVLDLMESIVKRGVEDAFTGVEGFTVEQYAQYLSNLTYDALHSTRLADEKSFTPIEDIETMRAP